MKVAQLVVLLSALAGVSLAGLLRVPRVYNALISTNQRLAPSRADTVSLPVVGPVALLPAAAAVVAEEPAPPPAAPAAKNASEAEAPAAANHTLVAPLAVYSPYYYSAYPYHYSPYLAPPLLHYPYGYSYLPVLPLAVAHPAPAAAPKPDDKNDAAAGDAKVDTEKDAVTVEAN